MAFSSQKAERDGDLIVAPILILTFIYFETHKWYFFKFQKEVNFNFNKV